MSTATRSGIRTTSSGETFIPSSRRLDGSTRKEIKVRPGYRPPEDVEAYKSRNAESFRNGHRTVPGVEQTEPRPSDASVSKNAKRREAARKHKETTVQDDADELTKSIDDLTVSDSRPDQQEIDDPDVERQKKIRGHLKKLRAVQDLKEKKSAGEKLTTDQLVKITKESEVLKDLVKLDYTGPEMTKV